jgi:methylmalonyl-CoA mutase N-terminal domain/subunit
MEEDDPVDTLRIDDSVEREQLDRLARVRAERDEQRVNQALENLVAGARSNDNTTALVLEAVRAYASVGEICGALRPVFGEYREVSVF